MPKISNCNTSKFIQIKIHKFICLILNNLSRRHKYNESLETPKLQVHIINKLKRNMSLSFSYSISKKEKKSLTPMITTPLNKELNLQQVMMMGELSTQ